MEEEEIEKFIHHVQNQRLIFEKANRFECMKIASTLPNNSVQELFEKTEQIYKYLNS